MEEHIGKRVNTERTEEAIDTGASTIATGCPFCRVMITDGVDDVAATRDVAKVEVLDVAQLLLDSLDTSSRDAAREGHRGQDAERAAEERAEIAATDAAAPAVEGGRGRRAKPRRPAAAAEADARRGSGQAGDRPRHRRRRQASRGEEARRRTLRRQV